MLAVINMPPAASKVIETIRRGVQTYHRGEQETADLLHSPMRGGNNKACRTGGKGKVTRDVSSNG